MATRLKEAKIYIAQSDIEKANYCCADCDGDGSLEGGELFVGYITKNHRLMVCRPGKPSFDVDEDEVDYRALDISEITKIVKYRDQLNKSLNATAKLMKQSQKSSIDKFSKELCLS